MKKQDIHILIVCLTSVIILFLLTPIDLFLNNMGDLRFGLKDIVPWFSLIALAFMLICTFGFIQLQKKKKKLFTVLFILFTGIFFSAFLQGVFLNIGQGAIDNDYSLSWGTHFKHMAINIFLWILIMSIPAILYIIWKEKSFAIISYISIVFLLMQGSGIINIALGQRAISNKYEVEARYKKQSIVGTLEDEFLLSKDENIIYFVSDSFGTEYLDEIMEKDPQELEFLDGFTYYPNMVSSYRKTRGSMAFLINGQYYLNQVPYGVFLREAVQKDSFWKNLVDKGFKNRVVALKPTIYIEEQMEYIENLSWADTEILDRGMIIAHMMRLSAYRLAPSAIKPLLFEDFLGIMETYVEFIPEKGLQASAYDLDFLNRLNSIGLSAEQEEKQFTLYYLNGPHSPLRLNRFIEEVDEKDTSFYEQAIASLRVMGVFIDQMKELGIYDRSTIIITADHASERGHIEIEDFPVSPILLVKPLGQRGEMVISKAPVAHEDIRPSVMRAAGGDFEKYGIPVELWEEEDSRVRKHYRYPLGASPTFNTYFDTIVEYEVKGDAQNPENYLKTGTYYLPKGLVKREEGQK